MKKLHDSLTDDMFLIPQPEHPIDGSADYAFQVSHLVSEMLRNSVIDRYEIITQISRLTGREVSKNMLDAWSSSARSDHNLPMCLVPVLEEVCGSHLITDWLVHKRGGRVAYGKETLNAKLGIALLKKQRAEAEYKQLQKIMEGMQ